MKSVRFIDILAVIGLVFLAVAASSKADDHASAARRDGQPSLAGQLLVATEALADPYFGGSVIYIVRHDASGAFGLIVNRPMGTGTITEILAGLGIKDVESADADRSIRVYFGGPVEKAMGFVLHTPEFESRSAVSAGSGLSLSMRAEVLRARAEGHGPRRMLFALGYTGWAPGQLESEMARRDWLPAPFDEELVFGEDAAGKWDRAMHTAGISL